MQKYRVMLNGRNFLLKGFDKETPELKFGFYVTRDVSANSFDDAELIAVDLIRSDEKLKDTTTNSVDDPPVIFLEKIRLLGPDETEINNSGFTFYKEDEDSEVD